MKSLKKIAQLFFVAMLMMSGTSGMLCMERWSTSNRSEDSENLVQMQKTQRRNPKEFLNDKSECDESDDFENSTVCDYMQGAIYRFFDYIFCGAPSNLIGKLVDLSLKY